MRHGKRRQSLQNLNPRTRDRRAPDRAPNTPPTCRPRAPTAASASASTPRLARAPRLVFPHTHPARASRPSALARHATLRARAPGRLGPRAASLLHRRPRASIATADDARARARRAYL
eukprot:CAMPEP_0179687464 /NCGR_PEP_ID=MMETSP0936-20121108/2155_1 /TAXON_ID=548131 ORGANISM="Ostreococcus mediterraneus, Strain clade-D-RCC2573" /NCGR_SAMPLE_ID=MMETSP0936 /ASSEMBLY_ACC=CAM_ASM_000574 /LENGTH=117 /DNA_ID=CAMNT_0021559963 /DNA_START=53 /DNA_END=406 /DNA_ORIENTATION=+